MLNAKSIISKLELMPHPEGGYFKEIYRADETINKKCLPARYKGKRNFSTSIYFMLNKRDKSHFHKINSDEIWHFYLGSPVLIHELKKNGEYTCTVLGSEINKNEILQHVIPKGTWFAAEVKNKSNFALIGCTVSPGFDFRDFELASTKNLISEFPSYSSLIKKFCIKD